MMLCCDQKPVLSEEKKTEDLSFFIIQGKIRVYVLLSLYQRIYLSGGPRGYLEYISQALNWRQLHTAWII